MCYIRLRPDICCMFAASNLTVSTPHSQCIATPAPIAVGYFGQYFIKPILGFIIAKVLVLCFMTHCQTLSPDADLPRPGHMHGKTHLRGSRKS